MTIHTTGNVQPLLDQLDKLARHNRQGSIQIKRRYYEAMKRFCFFLADEYHLQKLANISGKHLTAYVLRMQEEGKSPSTIKTALSAIRFFHDKISDLLKFLTRISVHETSFSGHKTKPHPFCQNGNSGMRSGTL